MNTDQKTTNKSIKDLQDELAVLTDEARKINKELDEAREESKKILDEIEADVDGAVNKVDEICADLDKTEAESESELDKLILEESEDLAKDSD